jgi:hypothetical protein
MDTSQIWTKFGAEVRLASEIMWGLSPGARSPGFERFGTARIVGDLALKEQGQGLDEPNI